MSEKELLETIKQFCDDDKEGFSQPTFKGTNLLIQILRESASKQSLKAKTEELITKENEAQEIVEEISSVFSSEFDMVLDNPKQYGEQLQYLRSNITAAKKKITSTKQYLLKNEKTIEQLNYNSMFNKMIYNRLKSVETEVSKFQLASSYLKSKRYLDCALSIPVGEGKSLLEENIRHKAEDLKNELSLAICLELYNFCFLTGNVILPTQNTMLERNKENRGEWDMHQSIPNMQPHQKLYTKYKVLKDIDLKLYIQSLWKFNDFSNKTGEIGVLQDAIKAAFNISRAQNLKQFVFLNLKKAISNIYLLTSIFIIYEFRTLPLPELQKPKIFSVVDTFYEQCQFTDPQKLKRINEFFVSSVALGVIVLRKLILVEIAYSSFNNSQYQTQFKLVLNLVLAEIKNSIHDMFFQSDPIRSENSHLLRTFILRQYSETINPSILFFPYQLDPLRSSFRSALQNLIAVVDIDLNGSREKIQELKEFKTNVNYSLIKEYESEFYQRLKTQWLIAIQKHLGMFGGRIFNPVFYNQHEQIVFLTPMHKKLGVQYSLKLVPEFVSEDKKEYIKEFVLLCFNIDELVAYFKHLPLATTELHRLILTSLILFQSRLISFCKKTYLEYSPNSLNELEQQRVDKKIIEEQEKFLNKYSVILRKEMIAPKTALTAKRKAINIANNTDNSIFSQYKIIQKIKVLIRFIQYLICYFNRILEGYLEKVAPNEMHETLEKKLDSLENINFQEGMNNKLKSIYEFSSQEKNEENQKQIYLVVFKRMTKLMFLLRIRQKNF